LRRAWLFYLILIFGLSTLPGSSVHLGGDHRDKIAHFLLYGGYGFLIAAGGWRGLRWSWSRVLLVGLGAGALTGLADECYQMLIPGRLSTAGDWFADILGATAGALAGKLLLPPLRRGRKKESA